MTLTQRPFCTSQSSTSSNVLASCRAHSQVKSSNGSRSTMRGWEGTAPPITPTCDHADQRKFSTVCDNSDLKSFSKFFMPNSVQYLFEFPIRIHERCANDVHVAGRARHPAHEVERCPTATDQLHRFHSGINHFDVEPFEGVFDALFTGKLAF